ncbi:ribonuclease G [candidate division WOR-3 bacterium]|uniref:Ribonuclease G n=1 Tax=candidate division WOR-3 bacterium TaxID=2052148 RepID=A0A660SMT2_UNCW3|nr:MAG: ribonuclease G [candidate division WOR-3 bacterium]
MERIVVIDAAGSEKRVAILDDGSLIELYIDRDDEERLVGNIYKGKVINVVHGLKAAFVNIGKEKNGFLPLSEIPYQQLVEDAEIEIESTRELAVKENQDIIIQVTKESYSVKGPRLTSYVSLPGRYVVLLVNSKHIGVSRKIRDRNRRQRLREVARKVRPPRMGLIVRTSAALAKPEEMEKEIKLLYEEWQEIKAKARGEGPLLLYQEPDLIIRMMRDLHPKDISAIYIDDESAYQRIGSYLKERARELYPKLKLYSGKRPIFEHFGIEAEITKALERKIWLKSGGYITIDETEALTAIDVNTGRFAQEKNPETLAYQTNLEAIKEIARQLRLRDIGGLVIIDLIDMSKRGHYLKIISELKKLLKRDRAHYKIGKLTNFGVLELTRERTRLNLSETLGETCPHCRGIGRVLSKRSILGAIERWLRGNRERLEGKTIEIRTSPRVADYIITSAFKKMRAVGEGMKVNIYITPDKGVGENEFRIFQLNPYRELTGG